MKTLQLELSDRQWKNIVREIAVQMVLENQDSSVNGLPKLLREKGIDPESSQANDIFEEYFHDVLKQALQSNELVQDIERVLQRGLQSVLTHSVETVTDMEFFENAKSGKGALRKKIFSHYNTAFENALANYRADTTSVKTKSEKKTRKKKT